MKRSFGRAGGDKLIGTGGRGSITLMEIINAGPIPAILVAEDDRLLRCLVLETLRDEGYRASGVESGAEALSYLGNTPEVALLVTDINMPGMSGLELVRQATVQFPTLKFLVMSGQEQVDESDLPRSAGFLQKPFSVSNFLIRVRNLLVI